MKVEERETADESLPRSQDRCPPAHRIYLLPELLTGLPASVGLFPAIDIRSQGGVPFGLNIERLLYNLAYSTARTLDTPRWCRQTQIPASKGIAEYQKVECYAHLPFTSDTTMKILLTELIHQDCPTCRGRTSPIHAMSNRGFFLCSLPRRRCGRNCRLWSMGIPLARLNAATQLRAVCVMSRTVPLRCGGPRHRSPQVQFRWTPGQFR